MSNSWGPSSQLKDITWPVLGTASDGATLLILSSDDQDMGAAGGEGGVPMKTIGITVLYDA